MSLRKRFLKAWILTTTTVLKTMSPGKLFVLSVVIVVAGIALAVLSLIQPEDCSRESISHLGEFGSKEAGLRASIPKLSDQLDRCPGAEVFRVMWVGPGNYQGGQDRHALLYYRKHNRIGYEDDFLSGFSEETYYADNNAIRAVAEKGGTIEDFPPRSEIRRTSLTRPTTPQSPFPTYLSLLCPRAGNVCDPACRSRASQAVSNHPR